MTYEPPHVFEKTIPVLAGMVPRVRIGVAVELSGLSRRTISDLAAKKKIPGAAKHGGVWTFDQENLAIWLKKGNQWEKISTSPKVAQITTSAL